MSIQKLFNTIQSVAAPIGAAISALDSKNQKNEAKSATPEPPLKKMAQVLQGLVSGKQAFSAAFSEVLSGKSSFENSGSKVPSDDIGHLQDLLRAKGYPIDDQGGKFRGFFGPKTEAAVRQYQQDHGLTVDGRVGKKTLASLLDMPASQKDTVKKPEMATADLGDALNGIDLKDSANIKHLSSQMQAVLPHLIEISAEMGTPKPMITSGNDSGHKKGSLHYKNQAIDIRGNNLSNAKMKEMANKLQKALGPNYDVLAEFFPKNPANDHIHIEYDPKK